MQNIDKERRLNSPTEEPSVQALICPLQLCSLAELCLQSAGAFQVYKNNKTDAVKQQGRFCTKSSSKAVPKARASPSPGSIHRAVIEIKWGAGQRLVSSGEQVFSRAQAG